VIAHGLATVATGQSKQATAYYRHVEMVDAEIGRILQALAETGQDTNTLVLLTADHGEGMAHHPMVRKSTPYDEASKVPFVVCWPNCVAQGRVDRTTTLCKERNT